MCVCVGGGGGGAVTNDEVMFEYFKACGFRIGAVPPPPPATRTRASASDAYAQYVSFTIFF